MSSRSPRKRKKAQPFNEEVTARLQAMGYTTDPRPFGQPARPLGERSPSPLASSSSSDEERTAQMVSEPAASRKDEGSMSIYEMMRKAEEGAAKLGAPRLDFPLPPNVARKLSSDSESRSPSLELEKPRKVKKPRPKLTCAELASLVAKHKETAVAARTAKLNKRARGSSVKKNVEREETPDIGEAGPAASWLGWRKLKHDPDDDGSEQEVPQTSSDEEDDRGNRRSSSPMKTPSAMLFDLSLSSGRKQLFPPSPQQPRVQHSATPAAFDKPLLPLSSPFRKPSTSPRKSLSKAKAPYNTTHPSAFASTEIPSTLFAGRVTGARQLRQRVSWILRTSREIARDPSRSMGKDEKWLGRELSRIAGCSDEWWRVNLGFYREEGELELGSLQSFERFEAGGEGEDPSVALYYAFVQHVKLCGHDETTCRYHRALVMYHSYRMPAGTVGKVALPRSFGLDRGGADWERFAEYWLALADDLDVEMGAARRVRSDSPKKKARVTVKQQPDRLLGVELGAPS